MNIVIACGGTGGHLFPGLAVAEVLKSRGHEVLLLISEKQIDATAVRDRTEFRIEKIPAVGLPKLIFGAVFFVCRRSSLNGFAACLRIYRSFRPDAVLGMGGFTSTGPISSRSDGWSADVHPRIERDPGQGQPVERVAFEKGAAGIRRVRALFSGLVVEVTGTPIRNSLKRQVDRKPGAGQSALKGRLADRAGDGRKPGSARDKPGGISGFASVCSEAGPVHPSDRKGRRELCLRMLSEGRNSRFR